jgi:hypothetical protein
MQKQYAIPIMLAASILLVTAILTSLLPLQFASGTIVNKPANPAGAPPGNTAAGPSGNMTGTPSANTTAGGPPMPNPPMPKP